MFPGVEYDSPRCASGERTLPTVAVGCARGGRDSSGAATRSRAGGRRGKEGKGTAQEDSTQHNTTHHAHARPSLPPPTARLLGLSIGCGFVDRGQCGCCCSGPALRRGQQQGARRRRQEPGSTHTHRKMNSGRRQEHGGRTTEQDTFRQHTQHAYSEAAYRWSSVRLLCSCGLKMRSQRERAVALSHTPLLREAMRRRLSQSWK